MTNCQRCNAKTQLFLCQPHTDELQEMLTDLPRLTAHLAEAATGQTRLGERSRRTRSDDTPIRVNLKASDLLTNINTTLIQLVQTTCTHLGQPYKTLRITKPAEHNGNPPADDEIISEYTNDTAKLAYWLAKHVTTIAANDGAGDTYNQIHAHISRILATINRPIPPRFCGPCPSTDPTDDRKQCGTALMARRDAIEVRCPQCEQTHNVEELLRRLLAEVDHWRFTRKEILLIMATLGDTLSDRTFRQWRSNGTVKPRGWRRPDGRISLTHHGDHDEPVYRLSDVRTAKNRPQTAGKAQTR